MGCSLGRFLGEGGVCLSGYFSRTPESARAAAEFTGSRYFESLEELVSESSVILITVPDQAIRSVYEQIRRYEIKDKIICHCSGSLSVVDTFPGVHEAGACGLSIHPLFPVSTKYETYRELTGAFFCLEGDEGGIRLFRPLLEGMGVKVQIISSAGKAKYHAACVMASNLMCALVQESVDLLAECGFPGNLALEALAPLIESNVRHIIAEGPVGALTGPVERADTETVRKHLSVLSGTQRELYRLLSLELTKIAREKNPGRDYRLLADLLGGKV